MKIKDTHITVLIIEDELHNSRMLCNMINRIRPNWEIVSILDSVSDSVKYLNSETIPDLIMLDIQLSDGVCFSIFNQLKKTFNSRIIFTTAYDEYAIRAFKVNSIDYLLKPIKDLELEQAFEKYENLISEFKTAPSYSDDELSHFNNIINSIIEGKKEYRTRFLLSGITEYYKLEVRNIAYIFSDNKVTFGIDFDNKQHVLNFTLEQLEKELNPKSFFRANRKIIVNVNSITKITNENGSKLSLILDPQTDFEIMISRLKTSDFKKWIDA